MYIFRGKINWYQYATNEAFTLVCLGTPNETNRKNQSHPSYSPKKAESKDDWLFQIRRDV